MTRKIGLAALTVLELPAAEQVSVAAQAGYTHVGLRLIPVAGQTLPPFDVAEVERRLADTGVRALDLEVFRLAPETNVGAFEPALATAERLGASELLVHGADPDAGRLVENFGRLCDLAARYHLAANLEPMPKPDCWPARLSSMPNRASRARARSPASARTSPRITAACPRTVCSATAISPKSSRSSARR